MRFSGVVLFACAGVACAAVAPEQTRTLPPPANRPVSFIKDIQPVLESRCAHCHGRGKSKGGFRLDTRETTLKGGDSGPAAVAGKSADSLLIKLVAGLDPDNIMPQKGTRLSAEQIGLLRAWIDQGLKWDQGVFLGKTETQNLKPRRPDVPPPPRHSKLANPIDLILQTYFAARKIRPPSVVDDRAFARRVWLDVIGLLPSPEEIESFVADREPGKRAALVRRLLADNQHYAEHWLTFWNDALRNDYRGTGYIDGGRKQITGWLFAALYNNLPYDQFVAQLINPTPESEGFTRGIIWRGAVNASQTTPMQAAQSISQVFLGVNLKCASCHDSFVSDWTLADAYGMASVYADGPLEMFKCDKPTGETAHAKFLYPELGTLDANAPRADRVRQLAEVMTSRENGRLTRTIVNRLWARFMGRGLVEPVDEMDNRAWHSDLLDWLAADLVDNGYDLKSTIERILTSRAYQLPAVSGTEQMDPAFVFRGPLVRRMTAEQLRDAVGSLTGVWHARPAAALPQAARDGKVRASLVAADPLMTALGRPNREQVVTVRASAATTLQALELTNGATLADILKRGAEKNVAAASAPRAFTERLYLQALGRKPRAAESYFAQKLIGSPPRREGVEDLLWAVVMLPEFQLIY
jgi:hypothetical protein